MDSRLRLERFLSIKDPGPHGFDAGESPDMVDEVVDTDLTGVKFGEISSEPEQGHDCCGESQMVDDSSEIFGEGCAMDGVCGEEPVVREREGEGVAEPAVGQEVDDIADGEL